MKKSRDLEGSFMLAETNQTQRRFAPWREAVSYLASKRPPSRGRVPQFARTLMPALVVAAVLGVAFLAAPTDSQAGAISIGISVRIGPPPLPVYVQPVCPAPGYMWTPGYWAYDPENGYFWVPGTWVIAPAPALLWTPGYWGWGGGAFFWHAGYWGPHVGFYGGINYGFGYTGRGFEGGEWRGGTFFYNRSVNNFGVTTRHQCLRPHGGEQFRRKSGQLQRRRGRIDAHAHPRRTRCGARPAHRGHILCSRQHEVAAHSDRSQFASVNHGVPGVAATARPGEFKGAGVVHSTRAGGPVNPEVYHAANPGHTNANTGARSPNPGGGGTHQVMTAHSNPTYSNNPGSRPAGPAAGDNSLQRAEPQ